MMYTLNIQANTPDELKLQLLGFLESMKGITFKSADGKPIDTEPLHYTPSADEAQAEPVEASTEPVEAPAEEPVAESVPQPTVSETEVRAALKKLKDSKGINAVKTILKEFGANSVPEIKPEDYQRIYDRAESEA